MSQDPPAAPSPKSAQLNSPASAESTVEKTNIQNAQEKCTERQISSASVQNDNHSAVDAIAEETTATAEKQDPSVSQQPLSASEEDMSTVKDDVLQEQSDDSETLDQTSLPQEVSDEQEKTPLITATVPQDTVNTQEDSASLQHEADRDTSPSSPSKSSSACRCFNILAMLGPVTVLLLLALQYIPGMPFRGLLEHEAVLPKLLDEFPGTAQVFFAYLNGAPDPHIMPVWLWFSSLFSWIATQAGFADIPVYIFWTGVGTLGLFILMISLWCVASRFAGGRREALAACILFSSTLAVFGITRLILPESLFVAFTLLSLLFLWHGWMKPKAPCSLCIGFLCAALAVFAGGFAGMLLPLLSSLIFLLWRGTFRRAGALDGAICFGIMLVLVLGWLAWLGIDSTTTPALDAFLNMEKAQWQQGIWKDPSALPVHLTHLVLYTLPWVLLIFALPWERLYRIPIHLWKARKEQPETGWLWCSTLAACILFALSWPGSNIMVLPLLALLSMLAGRAILRLSPLRSRFFFSLIGLCILLLSIPPLAALLPVNFSVVLPETFQTFIPQPLTSVLELPGAYCLGIIGLLFALLLLFAVDKRFPGGGLLLIALLLVALAQPLNFITLPAIAPISAGESLPQPAIAPEPEKEAAIHQPVVQSSPSDAPLSSPVSEPGTTLPAAQQEQPGDVPQEQPALPIPNDTQQESSQP